MKIGVEVTESCASEGRRAGTLCNWCGLFSDGAATILARAVSVLGGIKGWSRQQEQDKMHKLR